MIDLVQKVAGIDPARFLVDDPNAHLVGTVRDGIFGYRETWIDINDGRIGTIYEIPRGLLGVKGMGSGPCHVSSDKAQEYFSQRGVPDEVIQATIIPAIHAREVYNQQRAARQENSGH